MSKQVLAHILFNPHTHAVTDINHVVPGKHIYYLEHGKKRRHLKNHRQRKLCNIR